jgi:hypothetical protein
MQTDVRETAQNAMNQGKSFVTQQIDDRTTQIGQQVGAVADELRKVGDQLRASGPAGLAADYVDQGAEFVDRIGRYLQDADTDRLMGDLENIARQQPWAVAAGALVLGFAASRFLKTSSARRYREGLESDATYGSSSYGGGDGYGGSTYGETTYGDRGGRGRGGRGGGNAG